MSGLLVTGDVVRTVVLHRPDALNALDEALYAELVDLVDAAIGAGCTLALLCDVIFIAEDAYLADPHLRVGLVPGDGGVVLWPLLAGLPAARAYLLTGDRVPAAAAHRLGLVHRVVPAGALLAEAHRFAERVAALPAAAVRDTKRALNLHLIHAAATTFEVASEAEARSFDRVEHRRLTSDAG